MTQDSAEKDAETERIHELVTERAAEWDQAGQPDELLLRGEELDQIEEWFWLSQWKLTSLETQYAKFSMSKRVLSRTLGPYLTDIRKPIAAIKTHITLLHRLAKSQPDKLPEVIEDLAGDVRKLMDLLSGFSQTETEMIGEESESRRQAGYSLRSITSDIRTAAIPIAGFTEMVAIAVEREPRRLPMYLGRLDEAIARLSMMIDRLWQIMTDYS